MYTYIIYTSSSVNGKEISKPENKARKARRRAWRRRYSRGRFLGRHDIFGAGHGLVGDNAGGYVHDELGLLMEEAVVAINEDVRAVPGRVDEPHIVGRFVAPMARVEGRAVCRGRDPSQAVTVKVPYKRGALLGGCRPVGSGRRRVSVLRSRLQAKHGRGRKFSSSDVRREISSPFLRRLQPRFHEGHYVPPSAGPRGRKKPRRAPLL